jgi:hypothetical protein
VALSDRRDVTADLKKAGLSDAQIAYNDRLKAKVPALTAAQKRQLTELGLFGELPDGEHGALWEVQVNYIWKQKFPANKVVRVHHAYRPFYSGGPGESDVENKEFAKAYCADKDFYGAYRKSATRNGTPYMTPAKVSYILKTGNTWKRGIEDFTLNVIKRDPAELISLCFPGSFKKIDPLTYQVRAKNFQPTQDLDIYFGNIQGYSDNDGLMPALNK